MLNSCVCIVFVYVYVFLFSHGFIYCCIKYHSNTCLRKRCIFPLFLPGFFGSGPWAWLRWVLAPETAQFQSVIKRKSRCCPQLKSGNLTREVLTSNSLSRLLAGHYSSKATRIGALVFWWLLPEFTPSALPKTDHSTKISCFNKAHTLSNRENLTLREE